MDRAAAVGGERVMVADVAQMGWLDWVVVVAYLVGIIALGLMASRGQRDATDYFLAARSSSWPTIGLALIASNISSTTLIGLAGAAYATGISVFNYEWMAAIVLAFYCVFVLPAVLRSRVYTMPEFLERRFSGAMRLYFSGLTVFLNIVVDTAAALFAGALVFSLIFPGVPLWAIAAAIAVAAGIYTALGGLKAVLVTEVIQAVLLLGASVFIAVFAFQAAGGWDTVMASVPAEKLSLIRPNDDPGVPWLGLLTGVPLLGFYFWCTNQFMAQRVMSAKSLDHGRWGALFAGVLKLPILYLMVLPGTAAILIYPNLASGDEVYPRLVFDLLPTGIVGLVIAGFLAAIMSSIASTFNSASTLVTMDFARRIAPDMSQAGLVRVGRITTLVLMVLAVAWIPVIETYADSLWQYLQAVLAYTVPPVVAMFALGLFWKRANARGAAWGLTAGLTLGVAIFITNVIFIGIERATGAPPAILAANPGLAALVEPVQAIHFLVVATILFAVSLAGVVIGSLTAPAPPPEKIDGLMWHRADYDAESAHLKALPAWQNYRYQALALLVVTAVLVWVWR
jgi:solute:Na+ symporter, SSS family